MAKNLVGKVEKPFDVLRFALVVINSNQASK
jgi:hypothetical protein